MAQNNLIVLDRSETGLFWVERELNDAHSSTTIIPSVTDITDADRVSTSLLNIDQTSSFMLQPTNMYR
jgi:FlaA1/EpsC-like NDP-sugar epimerase